MMKPTQFDGESDWDAIVNHGCLDIEQEDKFEAFLIANGESKNSSLEVLEYFFEKWLWPQD